MIGIRLSWPKTRICFKNRAEHRSEPKITQRGFAANKRESYDPCLGCATHTLPGQMPLEVRIRDAQGNILEVLQQNLD